MSFEGRSAVRVGSRKSELALIQTKSVISRLIELHPNKNFEIHTMSTMGDRVLNISLPKIGEKSLFTRDLEDGLRNGTLDFVVHSLKDLPTALPEGMVIGAVLEREDARDALVLNKNFMGKTLSSLPKGSIIGTSSLRRTAQIRRQYPHLTVCDIRGNLNTRLAKLDAPDSKFAGIVLAQAGLVRMGWINRISQILEPTDLLYAVGQGALAVECRANDKDILDMLKSLMCLQTTCRILAERSFLKTLGGGCSAPVAVWSTLKGFTPNENMNVKSNIDLKLIGAVWSLDGITEVRGELLSSLAIETSKCENNDDDCCGPSSKRVRKNSIKSPNRTSNEPIVVDDDISLENFGSTNDIQHIIDIHGELFKKCPYSAVHMRNRQNNRIGDFRDECPLKIPVGQDFMGQCPYVGMDTKIIIGKEKGCPFSSNKVPTANDAENEKNENLIKTTTTNLTDHKSCPFLQKTIKMFDYADEDRPESSNALEIFDHDIENIYCGLYRHECFESDMFIKSFNLGQKLAEDLINRGALEVMKCAQAEIHSKS